MNWYHAMLINNDRVVVDIGDVELNKIGWSGYWYHSM